MTSAPLRCHLLIGPPGSGKTTFARRLAPLLQGPDGQTAVLLSTDAIREELFGDAAVQGPWPAIRERLLQRLQEAVERGAPVIIDATHARRPWRLTYTQALPLGHPVEWVGWWLTTPLDTCLAWARGRERPVPEDVIRDFHAAINHRHFRPDRSEGFAALVTLNPAVGETEPERLLAPSGPVAGLGRRISAGVNRQKAKASPHRYSRLLDLERLLFLLRLLSTHNGLDSRDPSTASALLQLLNPPPQGDVAERAAAYLVAWQEVHGGNADCYGDVEAIRADLAWLERNGFFRLDSDGEEPIELGEEGAIPGSTVNGGSPALADRAAFIRVFTLLRHILKEPFDAPLPQGGEAGGGRRGSAESSLHVHLIERLCHLPGAYQHNQVSTLRKDLENLLQPYGFRSQVSGRPESLRHGYALGTALLSTDQLVDVYGLLKASAERLEDPSQKPVLEAFEERLQWAGVLDLVQRRLGTPRRDLANRALTDSPPGTLADPAFTQRLERAIGDRRRIRLRHRPDGAVSAEQKQRGEDGSFLVWPLQILFHNISWYLAFERDAIGSEHGLIQTLRLDRLELVGEDGLVRRPTAARHAEAIERLQRLLQVCGGLYFGPSLEGQLAVCADSSGSAAGGSARPAGRDWYDWLQFSCTPQVFRLIREEPKRFLPAHTRYARPRPETPQIPASRLDRLDPNPPTDSHPYPVRILLPRWTLQDDWDLRSWLFRWGAGIRVDQPMHLRQLHLQQARDVIALYPQEA